MEQRFLVWVIIRGFHHYRRSRALRIIIGKCLYINIYNIYNYIYAYSTTAVLVPHLAHQAGLTLTLHTRLDIFAPGYRVWLSGTWHTGLDLIVPGTQDWTSQCRAQGCTACCWLYSHSASNCTGPIRSCTFGRDWCDRCTDRWDCTGHGPAGCAGLRCTGNWLYCCTGSCTHWYLYWYCSATSCTAETILTN